VSVELRPPSAGDIGGMFALVVACDETWREWAPDGWEPPAPESARWVRELGAADRWTRIACEPDRRIVGLVSWGAARSGPEWRTVPGVAHVGALFVHPERWRRGLAARLLDAALEAMRAEGYRRAELNTPEGAPAERFYSARGWEREGGTAWHEVTRLATVRYVLEL